MFQTSGINTGWSNFNPPNPPSVPGSFDKNYIQAFNVTSTVTVNHNLQKYPAVTIINSANDEVDGDVSYTDLNTLTLSFSAPFSGTVFCN